MTNMSRSASLRLLVANRGEIARRILRSGRLLGFECGLVVAEDDQDSVVAREVDPSDVLVVPSYLDIDAIVGAAGSWGATVVHPGYGFLSENPGFAQALERVGIAFAGPTSQQMISLGNKEQAKRLALRIGVPTLQAVFTGDLGGDPQGWPALLEQSGITLPWLIKASGGGGGRGMRVVENLGDLAAAVRRASEEAASGFGNPDVFIERYLDRTRHIEVQIFGDGQGGGVALGERECSLQRRHQKVIEEAPSPAVSPELRQRLGKAALKFVQETQYRGAGTVEFLLAPDGQFYFLEVNARLQVEHPVTEEVFGVDLVAAQLRLAALEQWDPALGDPTALAVREPLGHAIEARLLAEDPWNGFRPTPGAVLGYAEPSHAEKARLGLRIESALERPGLGRPVRVSAGYDSMVAKVVAFGQTRAQATERLHEGLSQMVVNGITTNNDFLQTLLRTPAFATADFHTRWIESHLDSLKARGCLALAQSFVWSSAMVSRLGRLLLEAPSQSWVCSSFDRGLQMEPVPLDACGNDGPGGLSRWFRLQGPLVQDWAKDALRSFGQEGSCAVWPASSLVAWSRGEPCSVCVTSAGGGVFWVSLEGVAALVDLHHQDKVGAASSTTTGVVTAPMPGKILTVAVQDGDEVTERQMLFVMESMKMQIEITAPGAGTIASLAVVQGQTVDAGAFLCEWKENGP